MQRGKDLPCARRATNVSAIAPGARSVTRVRSRAAAAQALATIERQAEYYRRCVIVHEASSLFAIASLGRVESHHHQRSTN